MTGSAMSDVVLLVRADASATVGLGHAMRCLALAEAWLEHGGRVTFAMHQVPESVRLRIERAGASVVPVETAEDTALLARKLNARFAVVDGYHLGAATQEALAAAGARLLVVDDAGETATRSAALVLNQNAGATPALYAALGSGPQLLLGPTFVLLRREFRDAPAERFVPEFARRVLVTFGGADTANLAPRAIEALAPLDGLDVLVVAGNANARASELRAPAGARAKVRIEAAVDDFAEAMRSADLAVIAAGSTTWELASSGTPMIAIVTAENQRGVAVAIDELGLGEVVGDAENVSASAIREAVVRLAADAGARRGMARRGRELIDGCGAQRVCAALRAEAGAHGPGDAQ